MHFTESNYTKIKLKWGQNLILLSHEYAYICTPFSNSSDVGDYTRLVQTADYSSQASFNTLARLYILEFYMQELGSKNEVAEYFFET